MKKAGMHEPGLRLKAIAEVHKKNPGADEEAFERSVQDEIR